MQKPSEKPTGKGFHQDQVKITFDEWVEEVGVEAIASQLGVSLATVRHWKYGIADPRVDQMRRIKKLTKGLIGYDQIIDRPSRSSAALTRRFEKKLAARRT